MNIRRASRVSGLPPGDPILRKRLRDTDSGRLRRCLTESANDHAKAT
jgi:hypothetical protein